MATRMQQRKGTAAQWTSANPILNAGEIGWESDTNKFKIGDETNHWADLDYFADINSTANPAFGSSITFEGATANDFETVLQVTDPTEDRFIGIPNVSGTMITTGNLSDITTVGILTQPIVFEGSTANDFETTLQPIDPTADRTVSLPDATGTVITTGNLSDITSLGVVNSIVFEGSTADEFELTLAGGDPTADRTVSFPDAGGTVVIDSATQTLTNKTLTTPQVSGLTLTDASIILEGSTPNDFETTLTVIDPTADRTITIPDATGTVALLTATQTFTNSKLTGSSYDSNIVDPTLIGALKLEGGSYGVTIASSGDRENFKTWSFGTDGVLSAPGNIIFEGATANDYETTLAITDPTADRTITLPDATGTVALTNNKLDAFAATTSAELAGVISDETGTGALVFADTPTLVTPNIGAATGTSLVLSGDLTVNGTTTTINSTTLAVDDKNIVLGDVETPTDTTADGGGITLKGATDKTFNWVDATDAFTSSEHMDLASGKSYYVNGGLLKDATETLTNKTLTSPKINLGINAQTGTSYTFVLADDGKFVTASNASAITVTIPPISSVAYPVGAQLNIVQKGAGQVTFAQGAGVTINSTGATATAPKLRVRYSSATAVHEGSDVWYVVGDIA
jgi:hypothetical protein